MPHVISFCHFMQFEMIINELFELLLFHLVTFVLLAYARCDAWLPKGLAAYLCSMYRRKAFGINDYRYKIAQVNLTILFFCVDEVVCFPVKYVTLAVFFSAHCG